MRIRRCSGMIGLFAVTLLVVFSFAACAVGGDDDLIERFDGHLIQKVHVIGLHGVPHSLVERCLAFSSGEALDVEAVRLTTKRLMATRLFESVKITPVPLPDGGVDLLVRLHEGLALYKEPVRFVIESLTYLGDHLLVLDYYNPAASGMVIGGSFNWSAPAGSMYAERTLFFGDVPAQTKLTLAGGRAGRFAQRDAGSRERLDIDYRLGVISSAFVLSPRSDLAVSGRISWEEVAAEGGQSAFDDTLLSLSAELSHSRLDNPGWPRQGGAGELSLAVSRAASGSPTFAKNAAQVEGYLPLAGRLFASGKLGVRWVSPSVPLHHYWYLGGSADLRGYSPVIPAAYAVVLRGEMGWDVLDDLRLTLGADLAYAWPEWATDRPDTYSDLAVTLLYRTSIGLPMKAEVTYVPLTKDYRYQVGIAGLSF